MKADRKLNKIERAKANLAPFEYYSKLDSIDFSNLTDIDRFYLKNFGIYNQKPRDDFFIRIRVAGGRISLQDLENILAIAVKFSAKLLLTARAQIELQDLNAQNILQAFRELEELNIQTWQTLTDNFRNIVTDVYDGALNNSKIEAYGTILQIQEKVLKNPKYVGMLPRKFNTAICANPKTISSFFGNDCYFALALKDKTYGFNLYLGGKNSEVAKDMNIFVTTGEIPKLFEAVIEVYLKYGNRASRTKARLYFLLEELGVSGFKKHLKEFYKKPLKSRGETLIDGLQSEDFVKLKRGYGYRLNSNFGEIEIDFLKEVLNFAKENSLEIRLGVDQNLYLLGLKEKKVPFKALSENQNILVCAGSRYCFFSLFDTKEKVLNLKLDKINKYGIKVGYSGCLKGCGRHYFSDIGFVGIRTKSYGTLERGVRLYLGGLYTFGESGARLIYWAVPLRSLNKIVDTIINEFELSGYKRFEEFSKNILNKFDAEFLAFWFLAKLYTKKELSLKNPNSFDYILENIEAKDEQNRLYEAIKMLEQKVYA